MELQSRVLRNIQLTLLMCTIVVLALITVGECGEPVSHPLLSEQVYRPGERMYREGVLPSGEPIQAIVKGDVVVNGTAFTCVSCHMRSGLGSVEGGVVTTPTNGRTLFQPRNAPLPVMTAMGGSPVQQPPRRPAYTEKTLATALRGGIDPAGRRLNDVMPRYYINDADMEQMISYLKSLSSEISPGITDKTLYLATIITDDVRPEHVDAMLTPLDGFIKSWNELANVFETRKKSSRARLYSKSNRLSAYQHLVLTRWVLKGPQSTWRSQLDEYYRKQPVFALVGGITAGDWSVVHEFSESNRIPCLFPQTEFPVVSGVDWYTLYLSKGYFQEGEAAANYINSRASVIQNRAVVQIIRDSRQGHALAEGFRAAWHELGHNAPVTITLKYGEAASDNLVLLALARENPAAVVIWDGPAVVDSLQKIVSGKDRPDLLLVSSSYLGKSIWTIPDQLRDVTHITYPYRLSQDEKLYDQLNVPMMSNPLLQEETRLITKKAAAVVGVLNQALFSMKEDIFRDYFLDIISMIKDLNVPLYERFSFGPGQRYASKGCYIVTLSRGRQPELIKKSEWVSY